MKWRHPRKLKFIPSGDPLIDEIRAIRHKISEEFGNDVNRLVDHLRKLSVNTRAASFNPLT